ncbi:sigma 54-interacting transcriptional regulator [Clostridium fermenticellae]|uniref:sigma 54-interacting transcriptional regulator n=1 Tax=Clostridium fermenticellae TaxID=2068654 RepID=UPI001FAA8688|nr:sigma 54-interacting transcriptional regulator [Clostridium fermenticellae]
MGISELVYKVKDIMIKDFLMANPDDSIEIVINKMLGALRREVLIVDTNNKLRGIFTLNDASKVKKIDKSLDIPVKKVACKNVIIISPDDSTRYARDLMIKNKISILPVVEDDHIVGIITNNKLKDAVYLKMNELFDLQDNIFDNLHEAVCICDKNGVVNYWNKSSEKLYGIGTDQIVNNDISKFFPNALILEVINTRKRIDNVYHEPVKGKGVILSAVPIYNSDEELIAVVSTDRDITDVIDLTRELENEKTKVEFLESAYKNEISLNYNFSSIIGKDKKIIDAIAIAQKVAPTSTSVLITGKSGTGKEVFSKAIHAASGRKGNFVPINCSAIPESLFESELFGYVGGAFTGAVKKGKIGKFELADNGTLFLDEIGDMPLEMQVKLLRVLQDGVVSRLGSEKTINTNTRIIAATNQDLKKLINEGKFREDLFYRLAVVQIQLPELKDRKEDIKDLTNLFLQQISKQEGISINKVNDEVYNILTNYKWEGNTRELRNVIQRMVVLSDSGQINVNSIPKYILDNAYEVRG